MPSEFKPDRKKPSVVAVERHERNGVKWTTTRFDNGGQYTIWDCWCMGSPMRTHSTPACPYLNAKAKGKA